MQVLETMLANIWCDGSVSAIYFKNIREYYEEAKLSIPESELVTDVHHLMNIIKLKLLDRFYLKF